MQIKSKTISDAWFQCLYNLDSPDVYRQEIERGSFENESYRLQYPFLSVEISNPLVDMVPSVPDGVAPPSSQEFIEEYYCDYILGGKGPEKNEEYTYAERIGDQLPTIMETLAKTPQTNQACMVVGRHEDVHLSDPACLREIDFKVVHDTLTLTTYWRSNDLWAGFPVNMGGMARLQEMVAEYIGKQVGKMYYYSSGSHIYEYQIPSIEAKIGKKFC